MGRKKVWEVHGIYPPAAPILADLWKHHKGHVEWNLEPIHYRVAYVDDMIRDIEKGIKAMNKARELGANTMQISRLHIGKHHGLETDIYFY